MAVATKPTMEGLLHLLVEQGATDLHLSANMPPHLRVDDRLLPTDHGPLSGDDVKELAYSLIPPEKVERFERWKELDFAFSIEGLARFRANYFIQQGYVGAAIRMLPFRIMGFSELGLPVKVVTDLCEKPKGLVLITGATGSGKTTTLASMVDYLNTNKEFHIITIEDPIEYIHTSRRSVIDQRELGNDTQSFAQGLKHVLRQDPDVILIGEMRDKETASIGVEASLTGHLVLSTLHTNSAPETLTRLLDLGLDPVNFSDALLGVLAQRLMRTLCGSCKESYTPEQRDIDHLIHEFGGEELWAKQELTPDKWNFKRKVGCDTCGGSGYRGRTGVHELLRGTRDMQKMIYNKEELSAIREQAIADGMLTLKQDGIVKIFKGFSDYQQLLRITGE